MWTKILCLLPRTASELPNKVQTSFSSWWRTLHDAIEPKIGCTERSAQWTSEAPHRAGRKNPHSAVQPPALGSPSIQLQPVVSSDIWWPEDRPVPAETGYKIDLTAEAFMMPKVMSPEFLSRLCEEDVPDVLAVFSCNPIAAAITFKWQTWRLFFCWVLHLHHFSGSVYVGDNRRHPRRLPMYWWWTRYHVLRSPHLGFQRCHHSDFLLDRFERIQRTCCKSLGSSHNGWNG